MSRNKWIAAIIIVGVLVVAFMQGGDWRSAPSSDYNPPGVAADAMPGGNADGEAAGAGSPLASPTPSAALSPSPSAELPPSESEGEAVANVGNDDNAAGDGAEQSAAPPSAAANEAIGDSTAATGDGPARESAKPAATEGAATPSPEASVQPGKAEPEGENEAGDSRDRYSTDPVPEGKPKPVEWQDAEIDKDTKLAITLSVTAATILNNMDKFNKDKLEVLPDDGIIYNARKVEFHEGESVFDVLLREMRSNKIHMEFVMTPIYNSNYVEGINNLYEFDCGELSGWMYKVNGWFPNYGSSRYALQDGDVVEWMYTCDLGRDIGGDAAASGGGR